MDSNKYGLQILTNYYRGLEDFAGNGLYDNYVEGCFKNGEVFRAYGYRSQFYLEVGKSYERMRNVRKIPVEPEDILDYLWNQDVFFKYVNLMLDDYKEDPIDKTPEK